MESRAQPTHLRVPLPSLDVEDTLTPIVVSVTPDRKFGFHQMSDDIFSGVFFNIKRHINGKQLCIHSTPVTSLRFTSTHSSSLTATFNGICEWYIHGDELRVCRDSNRNPSSNEYRPRIGSSGGPQEKTSCTGMHIPGANSKGGQGKLDINVSWNCLGLFVGKARAAHQMTTCHADLNQ
jgi:hypothetical protein